MAIESTILSSVSAMATHSLVLAQQTAADLKPGTIWQPPAASTTAFRVDDVWDFINWICYFFFALVVLLMIVFVVKYRHRRGTPYRTDYPHHNTPLELAWSIIPTLLVIGLFWWGFHNYLDVRTPPKNSYDIQVTAQKWSWDFTYPNGASSPDQQLYIPAGRPVRVILRSNDVLHAFYVPDFRVKQDVVPGRYTYLWFQSDYVTGRPKDGEDIMKGPGFNLFCAEYCGTGHSNMNRKVYVLNQEDFDAWLNNAAKWLDPIPDQDLARLAGPRLYSRCAQCHTLDGSPLIGPSWKGLYERVSAYPNVGPGKKYETAEDYIRASILVPGEYVTPGYSNAMPTFKGQIDDRGIDAIIGMMRNLDKFDPKTGKPLPNATWPAAGAATPAATPAAAPTAAPTGSKP